MSDLNSICLLFFNLIKCKRFVPKVLDGAKLFKILRAEGNPYVPVEAHRTQVRLVAKIYCCKTDVTKENLRMALQGLFFLLAESEARFC